ncbi:MAG: alpha-L-fucosidase [Lentisphaeria bacterium]|nr:alpha-L-fucosidase [Lentisphaeria bacterium]
MEKLNWFKQAKFGLFIHWGIYSIIERGEWVMYRERISAPEYAKYAEKFNPQNFSMDSLCAFAAECGMKYAVFTTCHHDGFAMFDSQADPFNSMNAPCHRDFVAEFTESCRKFGLKIGLYYSLGDWRYGIMKESDSAEKAAAMRDLTYAQVRELMSNYGKIDILWYDGGWCYPSTQTDTVKDVANFWRSTELNTMVRSLQPDILINNRSGTPEDFSTPEGCIAKNSNGNYTESCFTLGDNENSHWGYFKNETMHKSDAELMKLTLSAICNEHNLLVNVGPDKNGVIPDWQQQLLRKRGEWLKRYDEAAFQVRHTTVSTDCNGLSGNEFCVTAENDEAVFCYFRNFPDRETFIPFMKTDIERAILLNSDAVINCTPHGKGILLSNLPETAPDTLCSVIKLIKRK